MVKRKSKASRTSQRLQTTKVSKPNVLKDDDVNEDDDDAKSDHLDETVVDDTGEQVGTYNSLLASPTNTAHALKLRDTLHSPALLYPRCPMPRAFYS